MRNRVAATNDQAVGRHPGGLAGRARSRAPRDDRGPAEPVRRLRLRPRRPDRIRLSRPRSRRRGSAPGPDCRNPGPRLALDAATTAVAVSPAGSDPRHRSPSRPVRAWRRTATGSTGTGVTVGMPLQRGVGILEAVAGHGAHHRRTPGDPTVLDRLEQARDAGRRRGLDEHPFGAGDQVVCRQDLLVGGGQEAAVGLAAGPARPTSTTRASRCGWRWRWSPGPCTGSPSTSGAAPAAWMPSMRGNVSARPSRWYSV